MVWAWTGQVIKMGVNSTRTCSKSLAWPCVASTGGVSRLMMFPSSLNACLHTTTTLNAGKLWRLANGLPAQETAYGPLTDGPDFSYLDGRPAPPGKGKLKRAKAQREISARIMELSGEVDFAVDNYAEVQKQREERRADRIAQKLKPKGNIPPEGKPRW